ncbi:hypothetical protein [Periweissella fabalis]|uniref:Uncharacterized protein n=1 Tax=Periweissella fabalis TaxID=1070421 RepID=A0A7X6S1U4_9LACO|nr:hypothetical protein [Periweissella fabalis]MCM0599095.1 hypothetical protein [Periweissella fabalis]NKZ23374.1 hypothetical protein [Periweissella fabalis]
MGKKVHRLQKEVESLRQDVMTLQVIVRHQIGDHPQTLTEWALLANISLREQGRLMMHLFKALEKGKPVTVDHVTRRLFKYNHQLDQAELAELRPDTEAYLQLVYQQDPEYYRELMGNITDFKIK